MLLSFQFKSIRSILVCVIGLWISSSFAANESEFSEEWVQNQNAKSLQFLKETGNLKPTSIMAKTLMDVYTEPVAIALPNKQTILLTNPGLNEENLVILKKVTGEKTVLLNSHAWSRKNNFNFVDLSISLDNRYLAVTVSRNGQINDFRILLYDLIKRRVVGAEIVGGLVTKVHWISGRRFVLESNRNLSQIETEILEIQGDSVRKIGSFPGKIVDGKSGFVLLFDIDRDTNYIIEDGKPALVMQQMRLTSIISIEKNSKSADSAMYLTSKSGSGFGSIISLSRRKDDSSRFDFEEVIPVNNMVIEQVRKVGDSIFVFRYLGPNRRLDIYSLSSKKLAEVDLPKNGSAVSAIWTVPSREIEIAFSSPVQKSIKAKYNLLDRKFDDANLEKTLMMANGVEYLNEYYEATSSDGTSIPFRVVRPKAMLQGSSSRAAIMTFYGGFAINSSLSSTFIAFDFEFIKRGGVMVYPGIRGGVEYGEIWHSQSIKSGRQKVIDDVHATAKRLRELRIPGAESAVLTGWSNGALVAMTAVLQRPDLYAGVVAGNGVYDYLGYTKIDTICRSCLYEYGNGFTSDELFMRPLSPLEIAKGLDPNQKLPPIIVMNGRKDTRVNPLHSFRMTKALNEQMQQASNIFLISIENAGHFMTTESYQDVIAWRSRTILWSFLFHFTGVQP